MKEIDVKPEIHAIRQRKIKRIRFPKWAVAVSAACVVLIGANAFSVSAWDMNIFSAIVKFTKGGMSVNLNQKQNIIELPVSEGDPYGIKAKCAEYDIYPLIPHYLPEGFELVDFKTNMTEVSTDIMFLYKNGKEQLDIIYQQYYNTEDIPFVGVPTDTYNLQKTEINGHTMFILKEDNQFTVTYLNDSIIYIVTSEHLNYDECQKVVKSME